MAELQSMNWKEFYQEADSYFKTADNSVIKKKIYSPDLIYSLVTMAIEKYFMAFLISKNHLPYNHTLTDLITEIKSFMVIDETFEKAVCSLDRFIDLCSVDTVLNKKITQDDIPEIITTGSKVRDFVQKELNVTF